MAFVQANAASADASAASISTTLNGVASGNLIFVGVSHGQTTVGGTGVTVDDSTNTYTPIRSDRDNSNSQSLLTFYAKNVTGGNLTFIARFDNATASRTFRRIVVGEWSGLDTTAPLDVETGNKSGSGSSATDGVTSGSAVTTVNGDTIIGCVMNTGGSATIAAGTNYTERSDLGGLELEDLVQSSAGSIAATWTFSAANAYIGFIASFKAAGGTAATFVPKVLIF